MSREQYILGLNGFFRLHNASAALLRNGELVAMAEEDRFSRRKHAYGEIPHNAMAFCLDQSGITLDDVDVVGLGYDLPKRYSIAGRQPPTTEELTATYFPQQKFKYSRQPRIEMVPHHLAHAASAYFLSGFDDSAILVVDGQGEDQSTSLAHGKGGNIRLIQEFPVRASLGYFYQAVSEFIGLSHQEPGKTMGLASYGKPVYEFKLLEVNSTGYDVGLEVDYQQVDTDQYRDVTGAWKKYLEEQFGAPNEATYQYDRNLARIVKKLDLGLREKDIAASAQARLEYVVLHLLSQIKAQTGSENLCIAGGVGLNCSMNGRVMRAGMFKSMFIPPFTDDSGVGLGAALYLSDEKPSSRLKHAYFGPSFDDGQVSKVLRELGIKFEFQDDVAKVVAQLLSSGNIVSWFQGKMEVGPRALGNRSILADPTRLESHALANSVKNREMWRPLAPSFLKDAMGEYVEPDQESPFMLKAYFVCPDKRDAIPAVVHVDCTLRPQSVDSDTNPLFFRMIQEFQNITGIPGVLNTSFNLDSEPIVCTPHDAIRSFMSSRSNHLAIGNFLVTKS